MREPDFIIGPADNPYLRRWWVIPRNRFFNVYLHNVLRDDDDRALHDHPWWNISLLLKGRMSEKLTGDRRRSLRRFIPTLRRAKTAHRLIVEQGPVWTLFITGPRLREWGFLCPQGWRHWKDFTAADNPGEIGRGCE